MLSMDAARQHLAQSVGALAPVDKVLSETLNLRLAEPVCSDIDLPHWDVSAMDGYAVRWADLSEGKLLPVAFEVCAGDAPAPLPPVRACRIFTGAVIPAGADTVIPQEQATLQSNGSVVLNVLPKGSHLRPQGEVLKRGEKIGDRGDQLTPARIALLAAGGVSQVRTFPRPRVAIVMTGSELIQSNQRPSVGAIRDANGPMLQSLLRQTDFPLTQYLTAPDDLSLTCQMLEQAALGSDLIVTSGGVSVGDWDFIPRAVKDLHGEILFHKVAIKPGKPVLAAKIGNTWLVGLPGNPVSVLVCWRFFALPLGLTLSGEANAFSEMPHKAVLTKPMSNGDNRVALLPSIVHQTTASLEIIPLSWKGSHDLATAARANALLRLEVGAEYQTGDKIEYYPLNQTTLQEA